MRLPTLRTQFLAFLVPFLGVSLTFGGTGITARRAAGNNSSRTRVNRTMRATVGHEWDVLHEDPDRRWTTADPGRSFRTKLPPGPQGSAVLATEATPLAPPVDPVKILPRDSAPSVLSRSPGANLGRGPPFLS